MRVFEKRNRERCPARRIKPLAFSQTYLETFLSNHYRAMSFKKKEEP
jgi:hypothetical protein